MNDDMPYGQENVRYALRLLAVAAAMIGALLVCLSTAHAKEKPDSFACRFVREAPYIAEHLQALNEARYESPYLYTATRDLSGNAVDAMAELQAEGLRHCRNVSDKGRDKAGGPKNGSAQK